MTETTVTEPAQQARRPRRRYRCLLLGPLRLAAGLSARGRLRTVSFHRYPEDGSWWIEVHGFGLFVGIYC